MIATISYLNPHQISSSSSTVLHLQYPESRFLSRPYIVSSSPSTQAYSHQFPPKHLEYHSPPRYLPPKQVLHLRRPCQGLPQQPYPSPRTELSPSHHKVSSIPP